MKNVFKNILKFDDIPCIKEHVKTIKINVQSFILRTTILYMKYKYKGLEIMNCYFLLEIRTCKSDNKI